MACAAINGASADFRSNFGKSHCELSVKIPREAVNEDHLKNINSWFGIDKDDDENTDNECEDDKCDNRQKLTEEITVLKQEKTKLKEREEMFLKEYNEKLSALKKRTLEERDRSEEALHELVSARMEINNLKARRANKQAEGPVVMESLKKITEGECHGEGMGMEWNHLSCHFTFKV